MAVSRSGWRLMARVLDRPHGQIKEGRRRQLLNGGLNWSSSSKDFKDLQPEHKERFAWLASQVA